MKQKKISKNRSSLDISQDEAFTKTDDARLIDRHSGSTDRLILKNKNTVVKHARVLEPEFL